MGWCVRSVLSRWLDTGLPVEKKWFCRGSWCVVSFLPAGAEVKGIVQSFGGIMKG